MLEKVLEAHPRRPMINDPAHLELSTFEFPEWWYDGRPLELADDGSPSPSTDQNHFLSDDVTASPSSDHNTLLRDEGNDFEESDSTDDHLRA